MPEQTTQTEQFEELRGVEVFAPGSWHGRTYTEDDMDGMADSSNKASTYIRSKLRLLPIKLDHGDDDRQSAFWKKAAMGVATKFYTQVKDGTKKVLADYQNVPGIVAKYLNNHAFDRSVEKYKTLTLPNGETVHDAIASTAFLAANIQPEVKTLAKEFAVLFDDLSESADLEAFSFHSGDAAALNPTGEDGAPETAHLTGNDPTPDQPMAIDKKDALKSEDEFQDDHTPTPDGDGAESEDRVVIHNTVNVPDAKPEGYSEADLEQAKDEARQAALKEAESKEAELKAEIEKYQAQEQAHKQEQHERTCTEFYQDLSLGGSFDDLHIPGFMAKLPHDEKETFAEGDGDHSMLERFQGILAEFAKFKDAFAEALTEEKVTEEPMKKGENRDEQKIEAYMDSHKVDRVDAIRALGDELEGV